ncbi:MAG TPA: FHA domain-containing protein, partial [Candidatus Limnocylindrales bacterium]|nr:FHA domain-containing protein [Candidatus Limnocylindrales bacterium]
AQIDYLTDVLISRGIPYKIAEVIQPPVAPEPVAPEPVATPPVNESPGVNFLYIGLGAVALMLIVLAVVITGRGKKPVVVSAASAAAPRVLPAQAQSAPATMAKPEAAAAVTQARRLQPRPVIKGISGQFAGQTLELVRGQLIIGRDPKVAQVVYPQSSEDISRKHCTVRFDEESKKFMLEDSSSNGTFLASNQKLEPGKPYFLNPGDRFYVADPKEIFEVKLD